MKIAVVRGKFLNAYEMQFFRPLTAEFELTGFGSLTCYHDQIGFPVIKLPSLMDLPDFPYRLQVLNRIFVDSHYLFGLEEQLSGYDLVHTAETYFHFTKQCLQAKKNGKVKKVIATVLENIPFNNESIWGRKKFKALARAELDHMIALTNLTKQTLILEGANPDKISVIGHFVDTERFRPSQRRMSEKNGKDVNILFCGRLENYKGIFEILYAARLIKSDPDLKDYRIKYKLVGSGSRETALTDLINRLGLADSINIESVEYPKMPEVYRWADIYLAPSKSAPHWLEQYNTTLLEAQSSGLAIVASSSGGIPENVGEAAQLVPEADFVSLASSLKNFILHPNLRIEYGERARRRAQTVHDAKIGARRLAAIYRRVMSNEI